MSGIEEAERRLKSNRDASAVVLDGVGLTSIAPLLPMLGAMERLRSVSLSHNSISTLPNDLGAYLPGVVKFDLSDNPIAALRDVLMGLRSLPALRDVRIDLPAETEEDQLIVALPDLERFNGTSLVEDASAGDTVAEPGAEGEGPRTGDRSARSTYWTTEDSQGIEELFAEVTEASGNATHPQEFFDYLDRVVKHVTCLTAADDDPLCQEGEVLKARRLVAEYCFEEMAKAVSRADPTLGKGVMALVQYHSMMLDDYDVHWRRIYRDRDARLTLMKKDMKAAIKQIESLMVQVDATEPAAAADQTVNSFLSGGTPPLAAPAGAGAGARAAPVQHAQETSQHALPRPSPAVGGGGGASRDAMFTPQRPLSASKDAYTGGSSAGARATGDTSGTQPTPSRAAAAIPDNYNGKVLTLKQLKDTIEEVYASKTKYDAKCKESGLPRETMEQHLYTYLNQRYGLKEIILDWATAVAQGIKRFAADDNDVAVFGKILRNDIDEEFRYVQRQVRDTVRELIRAQVKGRHPLKAKRDIGALVEKKMGGLLSEEEWSGVVKYMYNKQDAAAILALVRKTVYQQTMPSRMRRPGSASAGPTVNESQIPYKDLVHLLLDFQLEGHERFLAAYAAVFRQHDRDGNGIVNSEEFKAIIRDVDGGKREDEVEAMAGLIDPFGSQLITYSESVSFLGDEIARLSR